MRVCFSVISSLIPCTARRSESTFAVISLICWAQVRNVFHTFEVILVLKLADIEVQFLQQLRQLGYAGAVVDALEPELCIVDRGLQLYDFLV